MPRGKFTNHKGRHRRFTNPDELEEERKREERKKEWRKNRGESSTDSEDEDGESSGKAKGPPKSDDDSESGSGSGSDDDSDDAEKKGKGVERLIEISNPNRVQKKDKKLSNLTLESSAQPELSRREREELQRQADAARYQKLHAEGKTREAQADLARLAIIKQQREDAAKKREAEKQQRESEAKERAAARNKALGKKS